MELKEHIRIFQELRKTIWIDRNLVRMIWVIATEHQEEIEVEDFLNQILPPREVKK